MTKTFRLEIIDEVMRETKELQDEIDIAKRKWVKPFGIERKLRILKIILESKLKLIEELKHTK